ncbi:MAG: aquaporin, partial [Acidimicrobiales bacterium]
MRKYLAEFVATFLVVFVAAGSIVSDVYLSQFRVTDSFGPLGVALAYGLAVTAALAAVAHVSGGHANPVVSIAAYVTRRLSLSNLAGYVLAQVAGATAASLLLRRMSPAEPFEFAGGGAPALGEGVGILEGLSIEVVLTFFLVLVVWGLMVDSRGPKSLAPVAIGVVVVVDSLAGGPFSGAAMNPARWLGPAVASGRFGAWPVWSLGPLLGALLGAVLYETFFLAEESRPGVKAPEDGQLPEREVVAANSEPDRPVPVGPPERPPVPPRPSEAPAVSPHPPEAPAVSPHPPEAPAVSPHPPEAPAVSPH